VHSVVNRLIGASRLKQIGAAVALAVGLTAGTAVTVEAISVDRVHAVWALTDEVGESSQTIPIRAAHPGCPSWSRLGGLVFETVETETSVTITVTFPEHDSDVMCSQQGSTMRATVKLDQPLGDREIIDGGSGSDPAAPITIAYYVGDSPGDPS